MAKHAPSPIGRNSDSVLALHSTVFSGVVARESCYPFYEPSYTELSHGCSQEVQGKRQKEVAVRILRTQEWRRSEADEKAREQCTQVQRKKVIASEIVRSSQERGTQVLLTEVFSPEEQRTEASSSPVAVSRGSRETRRNRRGAAGGRPC
jgi:5-deoxy-D-glucuronate isomerase